VGKAILPEYRGLIERIWTDARSKGRDLSAQQVLIQSQARCRESGRLSPSRLPRMRKTQMILKDLRLKHEGLPPEIAEMSRPWTLAASVNAGYGIPLEATAAIMRTWKRRLTLLEPLSIREARWVARLYSIVPDDDEILLMHLAGLYALWEYMCQSSGPEFDSSLFDAALVMCPWEFMTAIHVGTVKPMEIGYMPLDELVQLSWETTRNLPEEVNGVYDQWIWYLRQGPKRTDITQAEWEEIEVSLRLWVLYHPWVEAPVWLSESGIREGFSPETLMEDPLFRPSKLLKIVGY